MTGGNIKYMQENKESKERKIRERNLIYKPINARNVENL